MINLTDPRLTGRSPAAFYAAYSLDGIEYDAGYGVEFSFEGMRLLTEGPIPADEFDVRVAMGPYDMVYHARKVWQNAFPLEDEIWCMNGLRFLSAHVENLP